jgi:hypothetical protein
MHSSRAKLTIYIICTFAHYAQQVPAISISGCTPTTASVVALPNDVLEGGMKACDKTGTCVPTLDAAGNVM